MSSACTSLFALCTASYISALVGSCESYTDIFQGSSTGTQTAPQCQRSNSNGWELGQIGSYPDTIKHIDGSVKNLEKYLQVRLTS